jgi:hypothetical protein
MAKCILGQEYTDKITGFKGIAVYRTTWISGCDRIGLQPPVDKDGDIPDIQSFDEPMLVKVPVRNKKPGGPRPEPQRKPDSAS